MPRARALTSIALLLGTMPLAGLPTPTLAQPATARPATDTLLDGPTFRAIGPANMSGRIVDLAVVESDPFVFYVATATGGVWKTTNNGVTFEPVFEDEATHSVGDIAVHPVDTAIVWVGTGERANRQSSSWGDGIYLSEDGGGTWRNVGLRDSHHIGRIALHPADPDIAWVAAMGHLWGPNDERGLYRTTDRGATWERLLHVDRRTGFVDVAIDPEDPDIVYAASYQRQRKAFGFHGGGPGSALWKSTDGGETWRKLGPSSIELPAPVAAWRDTPEHERPEQPPTVHDSVTGLPLGEWGRIGLTIHRADPRILYVSIEQGYRYNASTAYTQRRAGVYRSEDRGETWEWKSDWNPRPMYASQPLVDPNDPCRVYMMNAYSVSTDCGETFERVRQSLHGDDRILWVDPADSRHVIKGDDGGVGISYDTGKSWLYVTSLPVSQYYRVAVDNAVPFRIYGGLQDNGSWVGPSATYRSEGILNEDWTRIGGGDGFIALPDTTDDDVFYAESQYLGLSRLRRSTLERRDIRPGDPYGAIGPRRNFDWFFADESVDSLSNAMEPANWDGPYIISPHDPSVLYAGTQRLWKSTDRGASWTDLGDMTTGTDRRELEIMGQPVDDFVPSIGDGIPYWPTLTVIAESPLRPGHVWVGTDDGRLRLSTDGGRSFTDLADRMPGLPADAWISGIEPSRHDPAVAYVVANHYRDDDFGNYAWRTTDGGHGWTSIAGGLPPERVLRTLREDPRNPEVLWLGAELGLFVSMDRGRSWTELRNGLPTVAVNDLVVHPRDNDLVLGTHGRGVWILDNVNAFQELDDDVRRGAAHLFTIEPAHMIRLAGEKAHAGDMVFRGENPPNGAIIDYWLAEPADSGTVSITVHDIAGREVAAIAEPGRDAGLNRVVWNLREHDLPGRPGEDGGWFGGGLPGPLVAPGTYTVRLAAVAHPRGPVREQAVEVREDPRLEVSTADRRAWASALRDIADVYGEAVSQLEALEPLLERIRRQRDAASVEDAGERSGVTGTQIPAARMSAIEAVAEDVEELFGRTARLYFEVSGWTGPPTAGQRSRLEFYRHRLERTAPDVARLTADTDG